jgi:hypothetical protein
MSRSLPARLAVVMTTFACSMMGQAVGYKDLGNRYEGVIDRPQAKLDYELLGFFAYREPYDLKDDVDLRVRFFLPGRDRIFLTGREIRIDKQYLMRPKPEKLNLKPGHWSEFSGWPTRDVIRPLGLPWTNLGVIVRRGADGEAAGTLAPALLYHSQPPRTITEYELLLTCSRKLERLEYEVSNESGSVHREYRQDHSFERGSILHIQFETKDLPQGPLRLRISGPYANEVNQGLFAEYDFYHRQPD